MFMMENEEDPEDADVEADTEADENETDSLMFSRKKTVRRRKNLFGSKKKIPMRQCVGCQEMKNKKELIR